VFHTTAAAERENREAYPSNSAVNLQALTLRSRAVSDLIGGNTVATEERSIAANSTASRCAQLFLFIVTYGRSGSTLLQGIIGSNPGYLIRGENNDALFGLYTSYKNLLIGKSQYDDIVLESDHPWYGINLTDPEKYAQQLARVFIQYVIQPATNNRVIGFKDIRYIYHQEQLDDYLDFLLAAFQPKIVFNIRKAEDVAKSAWWKEMPTDRAVDTIAKCNEAFRSYARENPERCYLVDYDTYVTNPDVLRGLFAFLQEPFSRDKIDELLRRKYSCGRRK
jgi:hypothetical protein